jgi:subtilase family serine protease
MIAVVRLVVGISLLAVALLGVAPIAAAAAPRLVTGAVDDAKLVTLPNTRPRGALVSGDAGALDDDTALAGVHVVLNRPAEAQAALDALVVAQLDPASPAYHHWLTPAELGAAYGPAMADVVAVSDWLTAHGLVVEQVAPSRMSITVSGNAGRFAAAFHTQLHRMTGPNGNPHIAPTSDLAVPAALAGVVHGATLSDYFPHPVVRPAGAIRRLESGRWQPSQPGSQFTIAESGGSYYAVAPADFATIYHVTALRTGAALGTALTGAGVGIAVIEDTDIQPADWTSFRAAFGLSGFPGTLTTVHPGGCADPGRTGDEVEGALDAEWASAVAPGAAITVASCASTRTAFGGMTALQGLVEQGTTAAVVSISYGSCEAENGASFQQMWTNLVEMGAAQGLSIFVATGDTAAAACDSGSSTSAHDGLAVNGLASNVYDTAVGGTDFLDTAAGQTATYWSTSNSSAEGSALSYVPETPWNDSCASQVIYQYLGYANPVAACNSYALSNLLDVVGAGGGRSLLYAKPSWQAASGVPSDGARDLPDVSLFAADGVWGHFYVYCMSDRQEGGAPCNFASTSDVLASAAGGTSFAAPTFGGIIALVVQHKGGRVGNAAPRLYALAQTWSSYFGTSQCRASLGRNIGSACVFNTVDIGTSAVPCTQATLDCYVTNQSTRRIGVLSQSAAVNAPAWPAGPGWSFANGLGSVNATNLVGSY